MFFLSLLASSLLFTKPAASQSSHAETLPSCSSAQPRTSAASSHRPGNIFPALPLPSHAARVLQSRPPKLFPLSSLQQLYQKAHFICATPSRLKNETKQHRSMERMLQLCFFFFSLQFSTLRLCHCPSSKRWAPLVEKDTMRHSWQRLPCQSQVLHKITS